LSTGTGSTAYFGRGLLKGRQFFRVRQVVRVASNAGAGFASGRGVAARSYPRNAFRERRDLGKPIAKCGKPRSRGGRRGSCSEDDTA